MSESDQPDAAAAASGSRMRAYWVSTETHERLKAAWWATRDIAGDGSPTLGALVERLEEEEAERLERAYNDGKPFPPAPSNARGASAAAAERKGDELRRVWSRSRRNATDGSQ